MCMCVCCVCAGSDDEVCWDVCCERASLSSPPTPASHPLLLLPKALSLSLSLSLSSGCGGHPLSLSLSPPNKHIRTHLSLERLSLYPTKAMEPISLYPTNRIEPISHFLSLAVLRGGVTVKSRGWGDRETGLRVGMSLSGM
ncbi:hypothetical protein AMTRI_Chr12g268520 [Amborella trichopoda]